MDDMINLDYIMLDLLVVFKHLRFSNTKKGIDRELGSHTYSPSKDTTNNCIVSHDSTFVEMSSLTLYVVVFQ
jgi:hypothetical protein